MRILVTGAAGFVGRALSERLQAVPGARVVAGLRDAGSLSTAANVDRLILGDLAADAIDPAALQDIAVVVHCAARVHVMQERSDDPLADFRRVNLQGTLKLAQAAAQAGVKRFIFLSTIKVNGEQTLPGSSFTADDCPAPSDPYAVSKFEAEQALLQLAAEGAMEVVIIRPPLVYGPGVKANFLSMMRWLSKGLPLPLGAIHNRRSLVGLPNLLDLLVCCLDHPAATNQVFLVSDGESLSTTELLRKLASALRRPARLLPVPQGWLQTGAVLLGRRSVGQRLCGSLSVDIDKNRQLLGWTPPFSSDQVLRQTALDFLGQEAR